MIKRNKRLLEWSIAAALAGSAGGIHASGFQLIEQNASGLGNAFAGQAASAQDASTIFFNAAGLTRIPGRQFVAAGHLIKPSIRFNDRGSTPAASTPGGTGPFAMNGDGGNAGELAFVPNLYASWQYNEQLFFGIGINVPFGLATDYDPDWMGRFHAIKSEIRAINVNPTVAIKVSDALSVGFGVNWQRADAELTKAVNYSFVGALAGLGVPPNIEGSNKIKGDDSGWGFNLGALIKPGPHTDIGFAYRSAISYKLSGDVTYSGRPAALEAALAVPGVFNQVGDGPISADLKVPASFSAAIKHQFNPGWMSRGWELLADVTWTQWSSLKKLDIVRSNGSMLESTPFEWRDTWRFGLGLNYRPDVEWTYRFGVAYDQTPTKDTFRTPRIPDQNRTWVALGAQYKMSRAAAIDVGYAHLFMKHPSVNLNGPPALTPAQAAGRGSLVGDYDSKVDIFSVQYRQFF